MKFRIPFLGILIFSAVVFNILACEDNSEPKPPIINNPNDATLICTAHLDRITVPVTFLNGKTASGLYIYSAAPDYSPVYAVGEGYTCVDDVARAVLFYVRSEDYLTDLNFRNKANNLIKFVINMQSGNGYFYNFLQTGNVINTNGITSVNSPKWWTWRALQALSESMEIVKKKDAVLGTDIENAINKIIARIKTDLINIPKTTSIVKGISVPQWLPEGADAAATLILGLIPYCKRTGDVEIKDYIRKLADGIVLMQQGDASHFPYNCILSSGNTWHAYGSDQSHALFQTGAFLSEPSYIAIAKAEVDNFYPWLIQNGFKNSFEVAMVNGILTPVNMRDYEQIAYGIRPLVFGAIDAYDITGDQKYATLAGNLASWFFGKNSASTVMYSITTGRSFDGITSDKTVNTNAGAEPVVEALLTMQRASKYPAIKAMLK